MTFISNATADRPSRWRAFAVPVVIGSYVALVGLSLCHQVARAMEPGGIDVVDLSMHVLMLAFVSVIALWLLRVIRQLRAGMAEKERMIGELREREMKYRSTFEHAVEGIFQAGLDGRFQAANQALAGMYGCARPEVWMAEQVDLGTQLYVEAAQRESLLRALQEEDVVSNFEFEARRSDGRTMWVRENVRAVRDAAGRALYLEGTIEDVSERWWSEQRRRLQYAMARVFGGAPSVPHVRPHLLEAVCKLLDWDLGMVWEIDAATGRLNCAEIWHTPEMSIAEFEQAKAQPRYGAGEVFAREVLRVGEPTWVVGLINDPGSIIRGAAYGIPVVVHGKVSHVLEFFASGTAPSDEELQRMLSAMGSQLGHLIERKNAERSTSELAAVVSNSNDAIVACTLDGSIRSWNLGAERIYGYAAAEVLGRSVALLFPPERLGECATMIATVRRGESLVNYETTRLCRDGRKIDVSLTDSPIRSETGEVTGVSSIARDMTERKALQDELLQVQRMDAIGRLAGGIAHDFNNILTAILGYSDLIIGQIDERQWMYKHLLEIRKAANFAAALTHQLLAFSRHQPLKLRVFDLNTVVGNLQKMLQRVIGEDVCICTQFDAKAARLHADPAQLEQVLMNLCVNARDAMPRGGMIVIRTENVRDCPEELRATTAPHAGGYLKLSVADNGAGIPPEIIKHIFEPFFTTKEEEKGTGLGLATCYGIVKQSGGSITVESTVGLGTTFVIYLPSIDEAEKAGAPEPEGEEVPGGSETILYVEDETAVRSLTAHVLRRLGYTVLEAGDGQGARQTLEAQAGRGIDLLFADVVLPDAGGRELSEWVRAKDERTKILFTTGYMDDSVLRRHGVHSGMPLLRKPFSPGDLARKVRETIDGASAS